MKTFDKWIKQLVRGEGFTSSLLGTAPTTGFAVATEFSSEKKMPWSKNEAQLSYALQQYIKEHIIPLVNGYYLGVWIDTTSNEIVFDISEIIPTEKEAKLACIKRNEKAYWDIKNNKEGRV